MCAPMHAHVRMQLCARIHVPMHKHMPSHPLSCAMCLRYALQAPPILVASPVHAWCFITLPTRAPCSMHTLSLARVCSILHNFAHIYLVLCIPSLHPRPHRMPPKLCGPACMCLMLYNPTCMHPMLYGSTHTCPMLHAPILVPAHAPPCEYVPPYALVHPTTII